MLSRNFRLSGVDILFPNLVQIILNHFSKKLIQPRIVPCPRQFSKRPIFLSRIRANLVKNKDLIKYKLTYTTNLLRYYYVLLRNCDVTVAQLII